MSPFRTSFNAILREAWKTLKVSTSAVNCAVDAMKGKISDADLTDAILDTSVQSSPAVVNLKALEDVALRGCLGGATSSASPQPSATAR